MLEEEPAAAAGELTPHSGPSSLPHSAAFWCPRLAFLGGSGIMYQNPARSLCSALSTLCCAPCTTTSSSSLLLLRSPVPVKRALSPPALLGSSSSASPRCGCCHQGASAGQCSAAVGPGVASSREACSMGNSTSRLYSTLAKTLNSSAAAQHREYLEQSDSEQLDPIDPKDLLQECQAVLQKRPPRLQRDFVDLRADFTSSHHPIRVMQWNILAQALGEGKDNFVQCPMEALKWEERKCLILEEILAYQPDILCLQEVDHFFDTFQPLLSRLGYQCTFFPKPWSPCLDVEHNNGPDGCALFFLKDRFTLISSVNIRLTAMKLKTNQVAIAQTLRCTETGKLFCIAVTHLKARTGWERFRSAQGCDLLQNLKNITQGAEIPLIICGDFNAEPSEEVYKEFSNSSLNLNSAYKLLSADGQSEPPYTTWKIRPSGECRHTLDYIWYSQHALNVNSALGLLTEEQIGPNRLPSFNYPSDHLSLVCDFSFNQDPDRLL
ncbi:nocturnin isoform X1 [Gopherus evgoodei]|uniref:Nocturnin n=1 Tax=Gopherus evgoodei TaxID=1825980 RepID=A0A8C4WAH1_9SAUR|nr:nocturnin isoform X1 [Gopherus evgoodei]